MRMKKRIGKMCLVAGVVMATTSLLPQFSLEVRAYGKYYFIEKENAVSTLERSTLSREQFIEEMIEENKDNGGENRRVFLHKLGSDNVYKNLSVKLSDLDKEVPDNVDFITIDGNKISGNRVVFMDKEDEIASTIEEYDELYEKYGMQMGNYKKVHTCLNIEHSKHIKKAYAANGLFFGNVAEAKLNDTTVYTQILGFSFDYGHVVVGDSPSINYSEDDYIENDKRLIEFIKSAGISAKDSDEEKVIKLGLKMVNTIPYGDRSEYGKSSNVFSVPTRRRAMCVGFSLATSRALNLLGIPAYTISGRSRAGNHAVTRAYYNDEWHTIDNTTSNVGGYDIDSYKMFRIDTYDLYDNSKVYEVPNRAICMGDMGIDEEYESWAETQETEDLVLVNKEAIFSKKNKELISEDLKQNLIQRYQVLDKSHEELKSILMKYNDELNAGNNVINIIITNIDSSRKDISEAIEKINKDKKFYLEEYQEFEEELEQRYSTLGYLAREAKKIINDAGINEEFSGDEELNKKADELLEKQKNREENKKEEDKKPNNETDIEKKEEGELSDKENREEKNNKGEEPKKDTEKEKNQEEEPKENPNYEPKGEKNDMEPKENPDKENENINHKPDSSEDIENENKEQNNEELSDGEVENEKNIKENIESNKNKQEENDRLKLIEQISDIINKADSANKSFEDNSNSIKHNILKENNQAGSFLGSTSRGGSGGSGGSSRGGFSSTAKRSIGEKNTSKISAPMKNIVTNGRILGTGTWFKDNDFWKFRSNEVNDNGAWVMDAGKWYLLDKESTMQTGLVIADGVAYYLATDGSMQTSWVKLANDWYYFNQNGSMFKGWLEYKGKWYYLGTDGKMMKDTVINGYQLDKDGVWVK